MNNFADRFGQNGEFTPVRQGTITANLCAGSLVGALIAGKLADIVGRRLTISGSALFCMIGTIIEISSTHHWAQFAVGRFVGGIGIGSLSVVVPMYQSESCPSAIRGVLVASYQLFITLGIWTGYMVDYGTEAMNSTAAWRIPNGLSFLWALILGGGILFLPESPRYAYRMGREDEARNNIARLSGLNPEDKEVTDQINDIRVKLQEERAGADVAWYEIFTGPRMMYRTILGIVLQVSFCFDYCKQLSSSDFITSGWPATHWSKFHLLLRYNHLLRHRPVKLLRHTNHSRLRQRCLHFCRSLGRCQVWTPQGPHGRCRLERHVFPHLRPRRPFLPRRRRPIIDAGSRQRPHCLLLLVRRRLCNDLGTTGLGHRG